MSTAMETIEVPEKKSDQPPESAMRMGRSNILVVDDDRMIRHLVKEALAERDEFEVSTASTAKDALVAIRDERPDVLLLDIMMPGTSGLDAFKEVQRLDPKLPVIFITGAESSDLAIDAMQAGAYDYVPKPLDVDRLTELVQQAAEMRRLMHVPVAVAANPGRQVNGDLFIGNSPQMIEVFKQIGRVSGQDLAVLIRGESGTGKELVARAIYQHSPRADRPFIAVNCAALPDSLLESELFGHEKGAFTGADRRRIGKFEQCDGGTIFLDEVGDMSPLLQSKILRLLQEQKFERVGGNSTIETDVRIITATNRDLEEMTEDDSFRSDLYYRLNGITISLPPLRERGSDVLKLLEFYLSQACEELNKHEVEGMSLGTLEALMAWDWPGNVRELQSVVKQMVLNISGPVITPECIPDEIISAQSHLMQEAEIHEFTDRSRVDLKQFVDRRIASGSRNIYAEAVEFMEKYVITSLLNETGGNQSKAARRLGITRGKLRARIVSFGISVDRIVGLPEQNGSVK